MNDIRLETPREEGRNAKGEQVFFAFVFRLFIFAFFLFTFAFVCPLSFQALADRTETKDSVNYGTDPEMGRAMDEQVREEKEKEEKAWKMLQNMNIYKDTHRRPPRTRTDSTPQQ